MGRLVLKGHRGLSWGGASLSIQLDFVLNCVQAYPLVFFCPHLPLHNKSNRDSCIRGAMFDGKMFELCSLQADMLLLTCDFAIQNTLFIVYVIVLLCFVKYIFTCGLCKGILVC